MENKFEKSDIKILIVDDSDFSRGVIAKILNDHGFKQVFESGDAESAMRIMVDKSPHILITDIVMPEVSGFELAEVILKNHKNVVVIYITSLSQEQVVLEAIKNGASDFLTKPVNPAQLIDSVEKIQAQLNKDQG